MRTKIRRFWSALLAALMLGCASSEVLVPILLPVAVCRLIDESPQRANYVRAVSLVVSAFATGGNLTPAELQAKLTAITIDGVSPFESQAIWAVVVLAFTQLADQYATDPNRVTELQKVLVSISAGLDSAVAQCGPRTVPLHTPNRVSAVGHVVSKAAAQDLANAIAAEMRR